MTDANIDQKLSQLRKEIQALNTSLKDLNTKKEAKYKEKIDLDEKLNSLIKSAKELKEQKQKLNEKVRELKLERDAENKAVGVLLTKLQRLKANKSTHLKKNNLPTVNELREKIKNIEFIIQTQAISFEREKKYMEQIKALKTKEVEVEEIEKSFKEINDLRAEINKKKANADELHRNIQNTATIVSQIFEELTKKSKEIAEIKEQRSIVLAFLRTVKLNIAVLNKNLNTILKRWATATNRSVHDIARKGTRILQQKTEEVREKFKKKKKLTTEDILLLQREAMQK